LGAREDQQDFFAISSLADACDPAWLAFVLADGMGGGEAGAEIAQLAVESLRANLDPSAAETSFDELIDGIGQIHRTVAERWRGQGGTTLVVARAVGAELEFASVGDSVLALVRGGRLYQLSRRHELVFDRYAAAARGECSVAEALADPQGSALTSFIGGPDLLIDRTRRPLRLEPGDCLIACSDGVSDCVSGDLLAELGTEAPEDQVAGLDRAITLQQRADQDNYTAVVAHYETPPVADQAEIRSSP
jgi:protein phosphatase